MDTKQAVFCLVFAALLCQGPMTVQAQQVQAETTITGRLGLVLDETSFRVHAVVTEQRPGGIYSVSNWDELKETLPQGATSGSVVSIRGRRLGSRSASGPALPQFRASGVVVRAPAPPRRLHISSRLGGAAAGSRIGARAAVGQNLRILVARPRLPAGCNAYSRVGAGDAPFWENVITQVNTMQTSCTAGKLSYAKPFVTGLVDIPCTPMPQGKFCEDTVFYRWLDDMNAALTNTLKIDTDGYDHILADLPVMTGCNWRGLGYLGGKLLFVAGDTSPIVIAHELGHNYGLMHSGAMDLDPSKIPSSQPVFSKADDSNLMGYFWSSFWCISLPQSSGLNLMGTQQVKQRNLVPGRARTLTLSANWGAAPQGATIMTNALGNLTLWASYIVSTDSPYSSFLSSPVYDEAIVLHLTHPQWLEYNTWPAVFRVRVLQSGSVFKWDAAGLVFKFGKISADKQSVKLKVCRETKTISCKLTPTIAAPTPAIGLDGGEQFRLGLSSLVGKADWCLRACTSADCALASPPYPSTLTNVYFSRPCPSGDPSALWKGLAHASSFRRLQNVATNKCLTVYTQSPLSYAGVGWNELKYRLVLDDCDFGDPSSPDFRADPQLFLPEAEPGKANQFKYTSSLLYPTEAFMGSIYMLALEGCPLDQYGDACTAGLPKGSGGTQYTAAVAGFSQPFQPTVQNQLVAPLPSK